jgi:hypothetical protein
LEILSKQKLLTGMLGTQSPLEYRVAHPRWRVWETQTMELHCDVDKLYGKKFRDSLNQLPSSAFLADGSDVKVYEGIKL